VLRSGEKGAVFRRNAARLLFTVAQAFLHVRIWKKKQELKQSGSGIKGLCAVHHEKRMGSGAA